MVSVCAGLVTVDEESGIIRLVHYTAQKYLISIKTRWFPNLESVIATACVTYLLFDAFESGVSTTDYEFEGRFKLDNFYDYAARNWGHYAREDGKSNPAVIKFLMLKPQVEAAGLALMAAKRDRIHSQAAVKRIAALHLVGYFGLSEAVDPLVKTLRSPDPRESSNKTPLWFAAHNGYDIVVDKLIAAGADVNATATSKYGRTTLQAAAEKGHLEVVEKLLAAGANVNASTGFGDGRTALQAAAKRGALQVVEKLLAAGANVNASAAYCGGQTALQGAAEKGHLEVVEKLLAAGAEPGISNKNG